MAFRTSLIRLATDLGLVILIALIAVWVGNYQFVAIAVILALLIGTPGVFQQAVRLRRSLDAPDIRRQYGPVQVVEHRRHGVSSYATFHWLALPSGERMHLEEPVFNRLAEAGDRIPDERPLVWKLLSSRTVSQLPPVVTTFAETGRLLLDVRTPGGDLLARHAGYATANDLGG